MQLRERFGCRGSTSAQQTNLSVTALTFAAGLCLNFLLVVALSANEAARVGVLGGFDAPPWLALPIGAVALDFATYLAHVSMHRLDILWRFHRVHHADPAVDITTTLRQHPGETALRYAFLALFAIGVGVGPAAYATYRLASLLIGLAEHANIRLPIWLDTGLSLVIMSPNMHKVHHSRIQNETDSNYGNILSGFDRAFGTFIAAARGRSVECGLDGYDDPHTQSFGGLMTLPFRGPALLGRPLSSAE